METCLIRSSKRNIGETVDENIGAFVDAVEAIENLEIIGTRIISDTVKPDEVFVLKNHNKEDGVEGRYVEVSIREIIRTIYSDGSLTSLDRAQQMISAILCERPDIILHGITRIVGYYSRVNNWNRSKIGELRDRISSRVEGGYVLTGDKPAFTDEALRCVNNLG